jgi:hypothetical protein
VDRVLDQAGKALAYFASSSMMLQQNKIVRLSKASFLSLPNVCELGQSLLQ